MPFQAAKKLALRLHSAFHENPAVSELDKMGAHGPIRRMQGRKKLEGWEAVGEFWGVKQTPNGAQLTASVQQVIGAVMDQFSVRGFNTGAGLKFWGNTAMVGKLKRSKVYVRPEKARIVEDAVNAAQQDLEDWRAPLVRFFSASTGKGVGADLSKTPFLSAVHTIAMNQVFHENWAEIRRALDQKCDEIASTSGLNYEIMRRAGALSFSGVTPTMRDARSVRPSKVRVVFYKQRA